jgi:hypothetical protein
LIKPIERSQQLKISSIKSAWMEMLSINQLHKLKMKVLQNHLTRVLQMNSLKLIEDTKKSRLTHTILIKQHMIRSGQISTNCMKLSHKESSPLKLLEKSKSRENCPRLLKDPN